MIKIEHEKLEIIGNLYDLTCEISYAVTDLSQKIQESPEPVSKEAIDFFEYSVLRTLVVGRCKDIDKVFQILNDKKIRKIYGTSIKEVHKSLELIRGLLDKEASGGEENDKD